MPEAVMVTSSDDWNIINEVYEAGLSLAIS